MDRLSTDKKRLNRKIIKTEYTFVMLFKPQYKNVWILKVFSYFSFLLVYL